MIQITVAKHIIKPTRGALLTGILASSMVFFGTGATPVLAQQISLSTYPSTLQIRAYPPIDAKAVFAIQNKSSDPVKLNIQLKSFKPDPVSEGKVMYVEGNDTAFFNRVQIVDNGQAVKTIELGAKQTKNLELRIDAQENEEPKDYYFSIIFVTDQAELPSEAETDATARSYIQGGIATNILYAVGPKELPKGYLEEFSTPTFRSSGPVPFTVKVKNNGTHYFTPKGVILIKNIFGQTVGRIDLQNTNIVAGTSRLMTGIPYDKSAKNGQSKKPDVLTENGPTAIWPEKFLLGFYTADLSLALSEEGPIFTQTIRFLALPTQFMLASFVAIIIVIFITLRVRRKLRES